MNKKKKRKGKYCNCVFHYVRMNDPETVKQQGCLLVDLILNAFPNIVQDKIKLHCGQTIETSTEMMEKARKGARET